MLQLQLSRYTPLQKLYMDQAIFGINPLDYVGVSMELYWTCEGRSLADTLGTKLWMGPRRTWLSGS